MIETIALMFVGYALIGVAVMILHKILWAIAFRNDPIKVEQPALPLIIGWPLFLALDMAVLAALILFNLPMLLIKYLLGK